MCEYCKDNGARIKTNGRRKVALTIDRTWEGYVLDFWTTFYAGELGDVDVECTANIKYCPMCGRKLDDDSDTVD